MSNLNYFDMNEKQSDTKTNALSFISWYATYIKLCELPDFDEDSEWNQTLCNMKNYSQKKMLDFMPANREEVYILLRDCADNRFLLYNSSHSDFWRKLNYSIVSFEGYEEKVLSLAVSGLFDKNYSAPPSILVLYRKEMLCFYEKNNSSLLSELICGILDLKAYSLQNACLPKFFKELSSILRKNYSETFLLVQAKIEGLVNLWDMAAKSYRASPGCSLVVEGKWEYFDNDFKEELLNCYK